MPFADTKDREIAEKVIRVLQSEKYKAKNYVFLQPFDTSLTPGYTETIGKPLDLQTVSESLQKDLYDEFTFWKDLSNVFHNAIKYHGDKQTKWIAQYATSMLKYMNKERKKAEQGGSLENSFSETDPEKPKLKNKLKIKLKSSPESMKGMKESTDGKASPILSSNVSKPKLKIKRQEGDMASVHSSNSSEPALKKPKLKLKMAGSKPSEKTQESTSFGLTSAEGKSKISSEVRPGDGKEATNQEKSTQPTLKLKLSFKSKKSETSSVSSGKDSSSIKLIKKSSIESSDSNKMKNSELQQSKASSLAKSSNANTSVVAKFSSSKDKEDNKGSKSTSNKISVKLNPGNRGKELPKAVAASQQQDHAATGASSTVTNTIPKEVSQTKSSKKKNKLKLKKSVSSLSTTKKTSLDNTASLGDIMKSKTSNSSIQTSSLHGDQFPTDVFRKQCSKVLSGLRRRQQKNIKWFANPITDKKILPVYSAKIKNPMDMQSLQSNLEKGVYNESIPAFCLDLRRIFANALQFNTLMKDMIRPVAIEVLQTAEDLLKIFLSGDKVGQQNACPPLLYCWKLCIDILNTIYKLENPTDGQPLALYFFHPVTYYYLGETPPGYSEKVKKPSE